MPWTDGHAMANTQGLELAEGWLAPLQADFLARFFATNVGQRFFLTGGTALSAFYLHHPPAHTL